MNRRGTHHVFLPEDIAEDVLVFALDFEPDADNPMPTDDDAARHAWHVAALADLSTITGVPCVNLAGVAGVDPDYPAICARLNAAGFDTYDSDTRTEVYAGPITCGDDCATECHADNDHANPHGIARPSRVDRARAWLVEMADYLTKCDEDADDVDAFETLTDALRALESADRMRAAVLPGINVTRCEDCGTADVAEYGCPFALHVGERLCLDCCGCPEHVEESHDPNATTPAASPDPETRAAHVYAAEILIGTAYRIEVLAASADEARALLEAIDPDDVDPEHVEELDTDRHVGPVELCAGYGTFQLEAGQP